MSLLELKGTLKSKKVNFGFKKTMKGLKNGSVTRIFLASNCPENVKNIVKKYPVEVIELKKPNDEIAALCKKLYPVNIISC